MTDKSEGVCEKPPQKSISPCESKPAKSEDVCEEPPQKSKSTCESKPAFCKSSKPKFYQPPHPSGASAPLIEFPHFLRVIGPKHIKILMQFVPAAICYGVSSFLLVSYITDWKAVLQYLPYYNGKFAKSVESTKESENDT